MSAPTSPSSPLVLTTSPVGAPTQATVGLSVDSTAVPLLTPHRTPATRNHFRSVSAPGSASTSDVSVVHDGGVDEGGVDASSALAELEAAVRSYSAANSPSAASLQAQAALRDKVRARSMSITSTPGHTRATGGILNSPPPSHLSPPPVVVGGRRGAFHSPSPVHSPASTLATGSSSSLHSPTSIAYKSHQRHASEAVLSPRMREEATAASASLRSPRTRSYSQSQPGTRRPSQISTSLPVAHPSPSHAASPWPTSSPAPVSPPRGVGGGTGHLAPVQVFCRFRPCLAEDPTELVSFGDDAASVSVVSDTEKTDSGSMTRKGVSTEFRFQHVFQPAASQADIYERIIDRGAPPVAGAASSSSSVIDALFSGMNATLLAYGQTGTGKTWSLEGPSAAMLAAMSNHNNMDPSSTTNHATPPPSDQSDTIYSLRGLIPRLVENIFRRLQEQHETRTTSAPDDAAGEETAATLPSTAPPTMDVSVHVSFFELYRSKIRDLLAGGKSVYETAEEDATPASGSASGNSTNSDRPAFTTNGLVTPPPSSTGARALQLQVKDKQVVVVGLSERTLVDSRSVLRALKEGQRHRTIARTNANAYSSRGHAIFDIFLKQTVVPSGSSAGEAITTVSRLRLVDLAGSEQNLESGDDLARLEEARSINRSLTFLGKVITSLASGSKHINYRDSLLTRVMSQSFGGNACTMLLVTCSPARLALKKTINTLRFGAAASNILNAVTVNRRRALNSRGGSQNFAIPAGMNIDLWEELQCWTRLQALHKDAGLKAIPVEFVRSIAGLNAAAPPPRERQRRNNSEYTPSTSASSHAAAHAPASLVDLAQLQCLKLELESLTKSNATLSSKVSVAQRSATTSKADLLAVESQLRTLFHKLARAGVLKQFQPSTEEDSFQRDSVLELHDAILSDDHFQVDAKDARDVDVVKLLRRLNEREIRTPKSKAVSPTRSRTAAAVAAPSTSTPNKNQSHRTSSNNISITPTTTRPIDAPLSPTTGRTTSASPSKKMQFGDSSSTDSVADVITPYPILVQEFQELQAVNHTLVQEVETLRGAMEKYPPRSSASRVSLEENEKAHHAAAEALQHELESSYEEIVRVHADNDTLRATVKQLQHRVDSFAGGADGGATHAQAAAVQNLSASATRAREPPMSAEHLRACTSMDLHQTQQRLIASESQAREREQAFEETVRSLREAHEQEKAAIIELMEEQAENRRRESQQPSAHSAAATHLHNHTADPSSSSLFDSSDLIAEEEEDSTPPLAPSVLDDGVESSRFLTAELLASGPFQTLVTARVAIATAELRLEMQRQQREHQDAQADLRRARETLVATQADQPPLREQPPVAPLSIIDSPSAQSPPSPVLTSPVVDRAKVEREVESRLRVELDEFKLHLESEYSAAQIAWIDAKEAEWSKARRVRDDDDKSEQQEREGQDVVAALRSPSNSKTAASRSSSSPGSPLRSSRMMVSDLTSPQSGGGGGVSVTAALSELEAELSAEKRRFMRDLHVRVHTEQRAWKALVQEERAERDTAVRAQERLEWMTRVERIERHAATEVDRVAREAAKKLRAHHDELAQRLRDKERRIDQQMEESKLRWQDEAVREHQVREMKEKQQAAAMATTNAPSPSGAADIEATSSPSAHLVAVEQQFQVRLALLDVQKVELESRERLVQEWREKLAREEAAIDQGRDKQMQLVRQVQDQHEATRDMEDTLRRFQAEAGALLEQERQAHTEQLRVAREEERARAESTIASKLRTEADTLRRRAAQDQADWMTSTKTLLDATLQKKMEEERAKWKTHYANRLADAEKQQRAHVASEVARGLDAQKVKWLKEQEARTTSALASQASQLGVAHAMQMRALSDKLTAEQARWSARETSFAQVLQQEQSKLQAQASQTHQALLAEQTAHRRLAQSVATERKERDLGDAQTLRAHELRLQQEYQSREHQFQAQFKDYLQSQYLDPLQRENQMLRDQLDMVALIQSQAAQLTQTVPSPQAPLEAPTTGSAVAVVDEEKKSDTLLSAAVNDSSSPKRPSKYDSEQQAMKRQIALLEQQLEVIQRATPFQKKRPSATTTSATSSYFTTPPRPLVLTTSDDARARSPAAPSPSASPSHSPAAVTVGDSVDYPFGSPSVKSASLLAHMHLADSVSRAQQVVRGSPRSPASVHLSPALQASVAASNALEDELNRSHQTFLGHQAQGARERLAPTETEQILDRVMERTVIERMQEADAPVATLARPSPHRHQQSRADADRQQQQESRLRAMEQELRATQESVDQLTNLVDAAIPVSATAHPSPNLKPAKTSRTHNGTTTTTTATASPSKLVRVIEELKTELGETYQLLGAEKRSRVVDHAHLVEAAALRVREEELHASAILDGVPTPPRSPRAMIHHAPPPTSFDSVLASSLHASPPAASSISASPIRPRTDLADLEPSFTSSFLSSAPPSLASSVGRASSATRPAAADLELRQAQQRTEEARQRLEEMMSQSTHTAVRPTAATSTNSATPWSHALARSTSTSVRPLAASAGRPLPSLSASSSAAAFRAQLRSSATATAASPQTFGAWNMK